MVEASELPGGKSSSKKRRKPTENGDGTAQPLSSKRQKITEPSPAPPARKLVKTSPVPFPTISPSPPASPRRPNQEAAPANGAALKKQAQKATRKVANGTTATTTLSRRTPVLPPPISAREKIVPSSEKNTGKEALLSSETPSKVSDDHAKTNGVANDPHASIASPKKDKKKKERASAGDKEKKSKSKPKAPASDELTSIEGSQSVVKPDTTQRQEPANNAELLDKHPQNVANLDPSNEISGRELPQSAEGPPEQAQSPTMPVARKKKKRKDLETAGEPFTDSVEALKDSSELLPTPKSIEKKKKKQKEKRHKDDAVADDAPEPPHIVNHVDDANNMALTTIKQNRELIKQNINVSRDFGLEGALAFPSGPDYNTGFHLFNVVMYLSVPPLGTGYPLQAAANLAISQYLFNYYPPARGILICHTNHKICPPPHEAEDSLTRISDGYADSNLWISADLYIFRPTRGAWLRGNISLQHESHIAIMIMGHWPASVARKRLPKSWIWIQDNNGDDEASLIDDDDIDSPFLRLGGAGYWSDGEGHPVMGQVVIRALDFDVVTDRGGGTVVSIEASMLDEEDDKAADLIDELSVPTVPARSQSRNALLSVPARAALPASRSPSLITGAASSADDTDAMDVDATGLSNPARRMDFKNKRPGAHRKASVKR